MADIGTTYLYGTNVTTRSANREDVVNAIVNIDPFDTPLLNMAPKVPINHVFTEWLEHSLPATSTAGRQEGEAFSADTTTSPSRLFNVSQIFGAHVIVSETQMAHTPYGFSDSFMYEVMRQTKGVMRNIENRLFAASGGSATGVGPVTATGAATARVFKCLQDFISATAVTVSQNTFHVGDPLLGGSSSASATTLNDRVVSSLLQRIYTGGGNPNFMFVSPVGKRQTSAFTGNIGGATAAVNNPVAINMNATDQQIVRSVNSLLTDFGLINVVLDRWVPQATISAAGINGGKAGGDAFLLELPKVQIAYYRPIRFKRLAEDGDRVRGMVVGELTLKVLAARAHGRLFGITNIF